MPYSELAYFNGDHCAHCAARAEHMRLNRIRNQAFAMLERRANPR